MPPTCIWHMPPVSSVLISTVVFSLLRRCRHSRKFFTSISICLLHPFFLPCLRSTPVTALRRYYAGSDSPSLPLPTTGSPNLTHSCFRASRHQPHNASSRGVYVPFLSYPTCHMFLVSSSEPHHMIWVSPRVSRLTDASCRIVFVILRAALSASVALHPALRRRSYGRVQA